MNAVDRDGRIIASTLPEACGLQAQPRAIAPQLAQVFGGRTQFIRPYAADARLVAAQPFLGSRPLAWVETPARDAIGNVVAALGFASYVDRDFESILSAARPGDTGEAYAFDETGTLLSEVRDVRGLHDAGTLPQGARRTAFRLKLRDPGRELDGGARPDTPPADWPLTRPVASALAAGATTASGTALRGVILDPYRNYRGAEVIGAWRWLPDERMGVVAEIGLDEAYAPLRYVRVTLAGVLALLVLTAGWAAWSTLALARLTAKPAAGRRIGAYHIERELAEGGTATVHLARHALLKRPTAIKILKRHMATDELAARFEREVRMVAELRHPNTIEIYDYGHTNDGLLYYAMEFVDGLTLDALVARERSLPLERMRHIVGQVCAALAEVHAKGMIHRDIKPENVMVCERGGEYDFVKLLDFGIVKRIEATVDEYPDAKRALTRQVRLLGTPAYMAPERIGAPSGVDARADVYGVGTLIYFLLAGRAPFEGADEAAILREVLATPAPRLSARVARHPGRARRSRRALPREGPDDAAGHRRRHRDGAGVAAPAAVDARAGARVVGALARRARAARRRRRALVSAARSPARRACASVRAGWPARSPPGDRGSSRCREQVRTPLQPSEETRLSRVVFGVVLRGELLAQQVAVPRELVPRRAESREVDVVDELLVVRARRGRTARRQDEARDAPAEHRAARPRTARGTAPRSAVRCTGSPGT